MPQRPNPPTRKEKPRPGRGFSCLGEILLSRINSPTIYDPVDGIQLFFSIDKALTSNLIVFSNLHPVKQVSKYFLKLFIGC